MSHEITEALQQIRGRRIVLEAELTALKAAEAALVKIVGSGAAPSAKSTILARPVSLTGSIGAALMKLGPSTVPEIAECVERERPGSRRASIRSILAMGANKGKFVRAKGGKWALAEKQPGQLL